MQLRSKLIIASLVILALSIMGTLFVQYFFQNKNEEQLENSLAEVTALSVDDANYIKKEIGETIQFSAFNPQSQDLYYLNVENSKFYKSNLVNSKSQAMLPFITIDNPIDVQWSPDFDKITISQQDNSRKIYLTSESKEKPLDNKISSLMWLNNDQLIANYYNPDNESNKLIIINDQGQFQETILDLENTTAPLTINFVGKINDQVYYLLNNDFFALDIKTKLFNKITDQPVTSAKISPKKDKIVYSTYADEKFSDYILDLNSLENKQLQNIDLDASSILWSNDENNLYLIKNELETSEGSGGYSYYLLDKIEKYNINSQQIESTIDIINQGKYGADDFFLSSDESKIYFINAANSYLYSINLK